MEFMETPHQTDDVPTPLAWHWPVLLLISIGVILVFQFADDPAGPKDPATARVVEKPDEQRDPYDDWGRADAVLASTRLEDDADIISSSPTRPTADEEIAVAPREDTPVVDVPRPRERAHIVKDGDTLGQISLTMYGSVRHLPLLMKANGLSDPDALHVGQVLKIPELPHQGTPSSGEPSRWILYTVKKNDSPWKIAKEHYGDGRLYVRLIEDNPEVFKNGETMLSEGSVIKIRRANSR